MYSLKYYCVTSSIRIPNDKAVFENRFNERTVSALMGDANLNSVVMHLIKSKILSDSQQARSICKFWLSIGQRTKPSNLFYWISMPFCPKNQMKLYPFYLILLIKTTSQTHHLPVKYSNKSLFLAPFIYLNSGYDYSTLTKHLLELV